MDIVARLKAEAPKAISCEHESFLAEAAIEIERLQSLADSLGEDLQNAIKTIEGKT